MEMGEMKKKDLFGDDNQAINQDDFGEMFRATLAPSRIKVGDVITGEILSIGKEEAFISTGTPTDGAIPLSELLNDKKELEFKVGDKVEVRVLRLREGEILLRRDNSKAAAAGLDSLEDAFDMELPIEGRVLEVVKGGFRVQVMGAKAFCPVSQMDLRAGTAAETHVGKTYEFIITQFEQKGRNLVVSRRKWLEQQKAEAEGEFLGKAKTGEIFMGEIVRLEKFGAFVRLDNGIEGLIPISEIAWGRVASPADVVTIGQKVSVLLLKVEEVEGRLRSSFSLKQAGGEGDPWLKVTTEFPVGRILTGVVDKKENFGLFVQLAPGVNGLLPRSKWRDSVEANQYEAKKKGDPISVMIDQIQFEEKRLTLGLPSEKEDLEWKTHHATAGKKSLGTFGELFAEAAKSQKK